MSNPDRLRPPPTEYDNNIDIGSGGQGCERGKEESDGDYDEILQEYLRSNICEEHSAKD